VKEKSNEEAEECAADTGLTMLKTKQSIHDRVFLIRKHLMNPKHPIYMLIKIFKRKFYKEY
jgi:hypothetical protein